MEYHLRAMGYMHKNNLTIEGVCGLKFSESSKKHKATQFRDMVTCLKCRKIAPPINNSMSVEESEHYLEQRLVEVNTYQ